MPSMNQLKKIQAASGLVMGVFVATHLCNHFLLNLSYEHADAAMKSFREMYQHPIFEIVFFLSLGAHFYSNAALYQQRSKMATNQSKKDDDISSKKSPVDGSMELKAHRIAGYILSFLVLGHTFAVRLVPLLYFEKPSDFDYSFAGAVIPVIPMHLFSVYYVVLGMTGGWHLLYGTRSALATLQSSTVVGKEVPLPLKVAALTSHLLIMGAIVALGRYAVAMEWPDEKRALHEHFLKIVGK